MVSTTKAVVILSILVFLQVSDTTVVVGEFAAVMSVNGFEKGEEGGPASCDGQYHNDSLFLVALNTLWYEQGIRCGKTIHIKSSGGAFLQAMVVDECDTENGCRADEISTSATMWHSFGLDTSLGEVSVTWSDVL